MRINQFTNEAKWSKKYKSSIDCANPKGFSQKAHCAGKKKNESLEEQGSTRRLTVEPHMAGLENPYQKTNKKELKVFTPAYKDMYNQARAAQDRANATGGPGASYQTPLTKPKFSQQVLPTRTTPKKPRVVNSVVEGYKLQLERDPNMYVLHITDTKSGKRTEVRGKSGYESGSYDANDKLHQLLDKIGKASNISELINGEVVTINPKHPDGKSAKKAADKAFNEAFVKPQFDVEWEEAERYPEFVKIGKEAWIKLAKTGKAVTITDASDINNTDAADPNSFKLLDPAKQKRALAQLEKGSVEMPIVAVYSDGWKELIGGNTRLTAMMARDGRAIVWVFNVPDSIIENFADVAFNEQDNPPNIDYYNRLGTRKPNYMYKGNPGVGSMSDDEIDALDNSNFNDKFKKSMKAPILDPDREFSLDNLELWNDLATRLKGKIDGNKYWRKNLPSREYNLKYNVDDPREPRLTKPKADDPVMKYPNRKWRDI